MALRTDFKDDVFDGNRKYRISQDADGNYEILDITKYSQEGDTLDAEMLNTICGEINDTKKSVSDGKALVAAAITAKKVAAAATDTFAVLADKIIQIVLGSGNATAADVVAGKTFTNDDGVEYTGSLSDYSGTTKSATASLDADNSRLQLTVPAKGKYDTASKLYAAYSTIRSLIGLTADKLWYNTTVLGLKSSRTGLAAKTYTPGTSDQTIASGTCITGTQTIKGDANLVAANIKSGVSIFGKVGTAQGYVCPSDYVYYRGHNKANFALDGSFGVIKLGICLNEPGGAYLRSGSDNSYVSLWTSGSLVDLTNASTIRIYLRQIEGVTQGRKMWLYYGADKSASEEGYKTVTHTTSFSEYYVDFDVSDITGSKYIGFQLSLDAGAVVAVHGVQLI